MKKIIGTFVLNFFGWTDYYPDTYYTDKCVMIGAPHTSFWDYVFAIASLWKRGITIKFLFHRSETGILLAKFLTKIGGVDIKNSEGRSMVDFSVYLINQSEKIILLINAEGSRRKVDRWKTGFYHIANKANVPLALGYLDYEDKISGVGGLFNVSGDYKKDMKKIGKFYKNFTPKKPKNYNKKIC